MLVAVGVGETGNSWLLFSEEEIDRTLRSRRSLFTTYGVWRSSASVIEWLLVGVSFVSIFLADGCWMRLLASVASCFPELVGLGKCIARIICWRARAISSFWIRICSTRASFLDS